MSRFTNKFNWLTRDTGKSITIIESSQLDAGTTPVSSSAGFELVCSYNWVSTTSPTIYVPGSPPQWKPVTLPTTLPKDSGTYFIDQDAFRAPAFAFEPMFAALDLMKPDFDFGSVDLVTNRNSLRKLFNFASGRAPQSWRVDVNLVQNTLILTRRERSTREVIQGSRNVGYGHNFERAFTKPQKGLEDSSAHERFARYTMGELNCVVRFEVDAWCGVDEEEEGKDEEHTSAFKGVAAAVVLEAGAVRGNTDVLSEFVKLSLGEDPSPKASVQNQEGETEQQAEKISGKLQQLSVAKSKYGKKPAQYDRTRVISRGRSVPHSALAEIKTKKKKARLAEALPQLWFGRTPLLLHATHDEGRFAEVERIDAGERFEEWETKQQDVLRKMVRLIVQLRDVAREVRGGACVVVCENKVRPLMLQVSESTARKGVLPEEIVGRYWRSEMIPPES